MLRTGSPSAPGRASLRHKKSAKGWERVLSREQIAAHFDEHGPMVYRRALVLLGSQAEAQDAAQEVFIRALRTADKFEQRSQVST